MSTQIIVCLLGYSVVKSGFGDQSRLFSASSKYYKKSIHSRHMHPSLILPNFSQGIQICRFPRDWIILKFLLSEAHFSFWKGWILQSPLGIRRKRKKLFENNCGVSRRCLHTVSKTVLSHIIYLCEVNPSFQGFVLDFSAESSRLLKSCWPTFGEVQRGKSLRND